MRYPVLLLDLDHTLIDSSAAEDAAFEIAARRSGLEDPQQHFEAFVAINRTLWAAVERGEIEPEQVRHERFRQFAAVVGADLDPIELSDGYSRSLAEESRLFPGAREVLESVAATATLAMVTNGLSDVQRARIEYLDLEQYFDVIVISSEIGVTKPRPGIFEQVFHQLGYPGRETALMVGDSLSSDIRGGVDFGIDTCWYNPHGATLNGGPVPTHVIWRLDQLPGLAASGSIA